MSVVREDLQTPWSERIILPSRNICVLTFAISRENLAPLE
jgi:hypothetical protein